ncbi:hypothetical protein MTO96_041537 [Rhipicephalus appendiculatus]
MAQCNYIAADGTSLLRGQGADTQRVLYMEATQRPFATSLYRDDGVPSCGGGGDRNCYPAFADRLPAAAAVSENTAASMVSENSPTRRYPQRIRKQPDRFQAS